MEGNAVKALVRHGGAEHRMGGKISLSVDKRPHILHVSCTKYGRKVIMPRKPEQSRGMGRGRLGKVTVE